jgi:hypothetical protein
MLPTRMQGQRSEGARPPRRPKGLRGLAAILDVRPRSFGNPLMRRQGVRRYRGLAKVPRPPIRTALHKSSSQSGAQNFHLCAKLLLRCGIYFAIAIQGRGFTRTIAAGCKTVGAASTWAPRPGREGWCLGADSNHRHADFQSAALPTELPRRRPPSRGAASIEEALSEVQRAPGQPSSSASSGSSGSFAAGTAYRPLNQRCRSTSAQRAEQNGRCSDVAGFPQIGHFAALMPAPRPAVRADRPGPGRLQSARRSDWPTAQRAAQRRRPPQARRWR